MTITAEPPESEFAERHELPPASACSRCGAPLQDDQEWCLECGAARTLIHRPPDWRIPLAVIGSVIVLGVAGFVIALIALSSDANRLAAQAAGPTATAITTLTAGAPGAAGTSTATATQTAVNIATWPVGLPGWTVVLAHSRHEAIADAVARRIGATGIPVGVLWSSEHPSLTRGFWLVFSQRYPTGEAAQAAATALRAQGQTGAHVRLVGRPGA